jgi:hypothetical protein
MSSFAAVVTSSFLLGRLPGSVSDSDSGGRIRKCPLIPIITNDDRNLIASFAWST